MSERSLLGEFKGRCKEEVVTQNLDEDSALLFTLRFPCCHFFQCNLFLFVSDLKEQTVKEDGLFVV